MVRRTSSLALLVLAGCLRVVEPPVVPAATVAKHERAASIEARPSPTPIARAWLELLDGGPRRSIERLRVATRACEGVWITSLPSRGSIELELPRPCAVEGLGVLRGARRIRFSEPGEPTTIEIVEDDGLAWHLRELRPGRMLAVRSRDVDGCVPPSEVHLPAGSFKGALAIDCATVIVGDLNRRLDVVRRGKAFVVVDRAEHAVVIVAQQIYDGEGATPSYARRATEIIATTWAGRFVLDGVETTVEAAVSGRVRDADDPTDPLAIEVHVAATDAPLTVTASIDPSHQAPYGLRPGYQHATDIEARATAPAHEFGHVLGLDDEYIEDAPTNGARHTTRTGPELGLMGDASEGARPTQDNYDAIVTGRGLLVDPSENAGCGWCAPHTRPRQHHARLVARR